MNAVTPLQRARAADLTLAFAEFGDVSNRLAGAFRHAEMPTGVD